MAGRAKLVLGLALLLLAQVNWLTAQIVRGRVIDSTDYKPIAFVHVIDSNGRLLVVCDLEGRFSVSGYHNTLTFSSVGYKKKTISLMSAEFPLVIAIEPSLEQLGEVEVKAGENPALRIIRNTQVNLERNAPFSLPAYTLRRYDRLVIGADSGSRLPDPRLEDHLRMYDLLIMESVVNEYFTQSKGKSSEVISSRVSGLNDPVFVFLMEQLHSNDFFGDGILIGGAPYVSPLASGSLSRYRYVLEESLAVSETDSLFTIRFEPMPDTRFDGLKGRMSVQSPDWAIRSVSARPAVAKGNIKAEIRQLCEKTDSVAWFPVLLNTRLWLTIPTAAGVAVLSGEGLSQATGISTTPDIKKTNQPHFRLTVKPEAWNSSDGHWQDLRPDSLNRRLMQTYRFMDSLGRAHNLGRWLSLTSALTDGLLRLGGFDFPINKLLKFNNAEGYRPGLAFITNERYSRYFSLGMYGAYATRLSKPIWKIDARLSSVKVPGLWTELSIYDVHEARESELTDEQKGLLNPYAFRQLFYSSVNALQGYSAVVNIPLGRITSIRPVFSREIAGALRQSSQLPEDQSPLVRALVTKIGFRLRLAPGESFMLSNTGLKRLSLPNPLLQAEVQRLHVELTGVKPFVANQLRVSFDYNIDFNFAGSTLLRLESGLTDRAIPALLQFQLPGSFNKYFLFAPFSFGTMKPGTYESPGFISLYFSHTFLPLRPAGRKFRPQPVFLHNMAIQALPWKQLRIRRQSPFLSNPVAESGLLMNNLLRAGSGSIGAGFLYRWDQNQMLPKQSRFIFKLAFSYM